MPVMMIMEWTGVTREQYDAVAATVAFERDAPLGGLFHVAAVDANGLRVTDVWERPEDFQAFVEQRLMPGVQRVGISGEPRVTVLPAIKVFAPGYVPK